MENSYYTLGEHPQGPAMGRQIVMKAGTTWGESRTWAAQCPPWPRPLLPQTAWAMVFLPQLMGTFQTASDLV